MENISTEFIKKAKKVYSILADNESKEIFKNKLLYSITGEDKYWLQISMNRDLENYKRLEKIETNEIIVYGAGKMCQASINSIKALGHKVSYICDKDKAKQGSKKFDISIISPEELTEQHADATVVIGTSDYTYEVLKELSPYFPEERLIPLVTGISLNHMLQQYFEEGVMEFHDGEVFVDCGCFDFETSERLMQRCKVRKVFAFEPDMENMEKVKKNIKRLNCEDIVELYPYGLWNESTKLYFNASGNMLSKICSDGEEEFKIEVIALDSVIQEKVTFIKMDIEGSEMKALEGAANLIKTYKPKLAISIYHKPEDTVDIPAYIHELVPEYRFFIRHYFYSPAETVLYAI